MINYESATSDLTNNYVVEEGGMMLLCQVAELINYQMAEISLPVDGIFCDNILQVSVASVFWWIINSVYKRIVVISFGASILY